MKSCGIVAEYDPFHNGHRYHLKKARESSQSDCLVVVMSGNFLQRGEPAILDKWQRTKAALENGADLVVELPFAFAVQSADYFAKGSIQLLQALGCTDLCFGTDADPAPDYSAFAAFYKQNEKKIESKFLELKNNGMNYPQQMATVFRELYPDLDIDFSSPNHILAMSYAKETSKYNEPMRLLPVSRSGSQYHDRSFSKNQEIASATAVRKAVFQNDFDLIKNSLPDRSYADLKQNYLVRWEDHWPFLKYQLLSSSATALKKIYQMTEGLEQRMMSAAKQAGSFQEFIGTVKTKRYTWVRLSRLSAYVLNQITSEEILAVRDKPYIRILGFNAVGQLYLNQQKKIIKYPLISNINKKNQALVKLDIKAGEVYQLASEKIVIQDLTRSPIKN